MPTKKLNNSCDLSFALKDPENLMDLDLPVFTAEELPEDHVSWEAQIAHSRILREWGKQNPDSLTHPPMNPERFVME